MHKDFQKTQLFIHGPCEFNKEMVNISQQFGIKLLILSSENISTEKLGYLTSQLVQWTQDYIEPQDDGLRIPSSITDNETLKNWSYQGREKRTGTSFLQTMGQGLKSNESGIALSSALNCPGSLMLSYNEGGNAITGHHHGKPFVLIGKDALEITVQSLIEKHKKHSNCNVLSENTLADITNKAKLMFAKDYSVNECDLHFIEQPGTFHLDMGLCLAGLDIKDKKIILLNTSHLEYYKNYITQILKTTHPHINWKENTIFNIEGTEDSLLSDKQMKEQIYTKIHSILESGTPGSNTHFKEAKNFFTDTLQVDLTILSQIITKLENPIETESKSLPSSSTDLHTELSEFIETFLSEESFFDYPKLKEVVDQIPINVIKEYKKKCIAEIYEPIKPFIENMKAKEIFEYHAKKDLESAGFSVIQIPGSYINPLTNQEEMNFFNMVTFTSNDSQRCAIMLGVKNEQYKEMFLKFMDNGQMNVDHCIFLSYDNSQKVLQFRGGISCTTKGVR